MPVKEKKIIKQIKAEAEFKIFTVGFESSENKPWKTTRLNL